jgi:hypothetical protein
MAALSLCLSQNDVLPDSVPANDHCLRPGLCGPPRGAFPGLSETSWGPLHLHSVDVDSSNPQPGPSPSILPSHASHSQCAGSLRQTRIPEL